MNVSIVKGVRTVKLFQSERNALTKAADLCRTLASEAGDAIAAEVSKRLDDIAKHYEEPKVAAKAEAK